MPLIILVQKCLSYKDIVGTSRENIILIDDVLYTGRTVRVALGVLMEFDRSKSISAYDFDR